VIRGVKRIGAALGDVLERLDRVLRSWAVAGLALLILGLALAVGVLLER
jgi:hypothetical protein